MKNNTKSIIYIALFVAIIFVSSLIKITVLTVPFTLQTMAVMFAACVLGWKRAVLAVMIYIAMGLSGIPVFSKGGGIFYIWELSFGYILGFVPMAIISGKIKDSVKHNIILLCALLFFSSLIMLIIGAAYAYIILSHTSQVPEISQFITVYFIAFIPAELIKSTACALFYYRFKNHIAA